MPGAVLSYSLLSPVVLDCYLRYIVKDVELMLSVTVTAANPCGDRKEIRVCPPRNTVNLELTCQGFKGKI